MPGNDEFAERQLFALPEIVLADEPGGVLLVEAEPARRLDLQVLDPHPTLAGRPLELDRGHAVERRIEDAGHQVVQVDPFQVLDQLVAQLGRRRRGLFALEAAGLELKFLFQRAELAGLDDAAKVAVGGQALQDLGAVAELAQDRIGIRQ